MRKFKNITFGGIQQKIFNLVAITIVLIMVVYAVVIFHQSNELTNLVKDTNESQRQSIASLSNDTMAAILDSTLSQSILMESYIASDIFGDTIRVVNIVADYTSKLFANPDYYPMREFSLPDITKDGEISMQVLTEDGIDLSDPNISKKLALIGNLSELMMAVYADSNVDSCYVALPDGVMLLVDDHSATKFDENGNLIPIPIRERLWYMGAKNTHKLHFTDVTTDLFTGEISIMCSLPIYQDGELVAVIGADLFLNDISDAINGTARDGSFTCIINQNGHVLFSPVTDGVFRVLPANETQDLRTYNNPQLTQFINDSLAKNTDLRLIDIGGTLYYLIGAPIQNIGWAVLSVVPKALAEQPATIMNNQFDTIQNQAIETFNKGMSNSKLTIFILLGVVIILSIAATLIVSKRITKPLTLITNRVHSLGGDDLQFRMEDAYRTHDEIEVLAESFAMLSGKTIEYISEVKRVTAEKERIGAELNVATQIQADMLPRIFPAFPDRPEIDIFASMTPAKEVGGDFYDFFLIDDCHLALVMADVSGKGVPAALFMVIAKTLLKNQAQAGEYSPSKVLAHVNEQLCESNDAELFVTVWLGIIDLNTGKGLAANAGHEHPALRRAGEKYELIEYRHSPAVATMPGIKFREHEFEIHPGDSIFVYTDGVAEATNSNNELFGSARIVQTLNASPDSNPKEIIENMKRAIDDFVGDAPQFDDITMLCMNYKGKDFDKQ